MRLTKYVGDKKARLMMNLTYTERMERETTGLKFEADEWKFKMLPPPVILE